MRDATRGGIAAVLHEWANTSRLTLTLDESRIPISDEVRGPSELLGLDPLHIANEGTMLIAVPGGSEDAAIEALHAVPAGSFACAIGRVAQNRGTSVMLRRSLGREQPLDLPSSALLPRIC
jgi:hydrogenase expression/formation protein HypE